MKTVEYDIVNSCGYYSNILRIEMKLENYSKISKLIWDAWSNGKITAEEKDEMLRHIVQPPILEEENTGLKLISGGLLFVVVIMFITLMVFCGA
jgi:hypothetical protein